MERKVSSWLINGRERHHRPRVEPQSEFFRSLFLQVAVVKVQTGETTEEAWQRHLRYHPEDRYASVKIVNMT